MRREIEIEFAVGDENQMSKHSKSNRRVFLATCAVASSFVDYRAATGNENSATENDSKNDRPRFGLIGAGWQPDWKRQGRGIAIARQAQQLGDVSMVCEVDAVAGQWSQNELGAQSTQLVDDYRRVLDDSRIDAVLIATPDHWHAKIATEAMMAGKDVYLEKPATVTIDEGKQLQKVVEATGHVLQVGTQQRSEYQQNFLKAIALLRAGRIGKLRQIKIGLGPGWKGGPFPKQTVPQGLDWNQWLGPAPWAEYRKERTHRTFRWWYEYAGGQLADWGAHHVDIAQWAIGQDNFGPVRVESSAVLNQPLHQGQPQQEDTYNTPVDFNVVCRFDATRCVVPCVGDTVDMHIDTGRNGITFEGEEGRFFVSRGTIEGTPVTALREDPLPPGAIAEINGLVEPRSHMQNFVDCLRTRKRPVAHLASHHRTISTCHLANLSVRLGRSLDWDAASEHFVGDDQADAMLAREQRKDFEIPSL